MMYVLPRREPMLINTIKISRKRSRNQSIEAEATAASKKRRVAVKTVRFANTDTVEIISSDDTSSPSNNWITKKDIVRFHVDVKQDVVYLAGLMKQKRMHDFDQTKHCSVGVEKYCRTAATRSQRQASNMQHFRSVLNLQEAQRKLGISNPEAIRQIAEETSQESRQRAISLAAGLWKRP
ncbi:expressed unknown protein [Seminavis robusta]|uniref:Uncharacterized protein n=1 Tax=Seminavis robusta TaxID=568900 RepID=A0A9N8DUZ9_9STRA|nr:expressed unknown protein [Seminavis robusta]|eukprot:Sro296_g110630.1 n/a (180) ;mRNA; f:18981-19520